MERKARTLSGVVLGCVFLAGCADVFSSIGVLSPRGPIGAANKLILINSVGIMLAIVIPSIIATFLFAWWFRASNTRAVYTPDWEYSGRVELVVWSIPILVVVLLAGVAWIGAHQLDAAEPIPSEHKTLDVQVVALDWKWLFIYPDQRVASVNILNLPVGVPVRFKLTSASVMNSFFIPQLGSMIYTMNGMTTTLYLQADKAGTYNGLSSHFSGDGFSKMSFKVQAMPQAEFDAWVQASAASPNVLDRASYEQLAKQTFGAKAAVMRLGEEGLFLKIATQEIPPSAGPKLTEMTHTPDVSPRSGETDAR